MINIERKIKELELFLSEKVGQYDITSIHAVPGLGLRAEFCQAGGDDTFLYVSDSGRIYNKDLTDVLATDIALMEETHQHTGFIQNLCDEFYQEKSKIENMLMDNENRNYVSTVLDFEAGVLTDNPTIPVIKSISLPSDNSILFLFESGLEIGFNPSGFINENGDDITDTVSHHTEYEYNPEDYYMEIE